MPHSPKVVRDGSRWRTICNCRTSSPFYGTEGEADDWRIHHIRLAEQAMVHLRSKNPSVKNQFEYYSERATDPEETRENRVIWQQLADGLRPRVAAPAVDEPLPFEVKYTPKKNRRDDP